MNHERKPDKARTTKDTFEVLGQNPNTKEWTVLCVKETKAEATRSARAFIRSQHIKVDVRIKREKI